MEYWSWEHLIGIIFTVRTRGIQSLSSFPDALMSVDPDWRCKPVFKMARMSQNLGCFSTSKIASPLNVSPAVADTEGSPGKSSTKT